MRSSDGNIVMHCSICIPLFHFYEVFATRLKLANILFFATKLLNLLLNMILNISFRIIMIANNKNALTT